MLLYQLLCFVRQVLKFWLDIERYNSIDESLVFVKWQHFREIQLRYFQMGVLQFPETEVSADGVIASNTQTKLQLVFS